MSASSGLFSVFSALSEDCVAHILDSCDTPSLLAFMQTTRFGATLACRPQVVRDVTFAKFVRDHDDWDHNGRMVLFCDFVLKYNLAIYIRHLEFQMQPLEEDCPRFAYLLADILPKAIHLMSFSSPPHGRHIITAFDQELGIWDALRDHPQSLIDIPHCFMSPRALSVLRSMRGGLHHLGISIDGNKNFDGPYVTDLAAIIAKSANTLVNLSMTAHCELHRDTVMPAPTIVDTPFSVTPASCPMPELHRLDKLVLKDAPIELSFLHSRTPNLRSLSFINCPAAGGPEATPFTSTWPKLTFLRGPEELVCSILQQDCQTLRWLSVVDDPWGGAFLNRTGIQQFFDLTQSLKLEALDLSDVPIALDPPSLFSSLSTGTPHIRVLHLSLEHADEGHGERRLEDFLKLTSLGTEQLLHPKNLAFVKLEAIIVLPSDYSPLPSEIAIRWFHAIPSLKVFQLCVSTCNWDMKTTSTAEFWFRREAIDGEDKFGMIELEADIGRAEHSKLLGDLEELEDISFR